LKTRLREDAPAVLYGCCDINLLETGGLAARARKTIVSGSAKGIDQAAMRGAIEEGGKVSGVLADSLERTAMKREPRNLLIDGQFVLISPYDPNAGFNVGNAMQRNKFIYDFADASLVVNSDFKRGGTWTGASEQLDKLKFPST
jgi:DNA processing protein